MAHWTVTYHDEHGTQQTREVDATEKVTTDGVVAFVAQPETDGETSIVWEIPELSIVRMDPPDLSATYLPEADN